MKAGRSNEDFLVDPLGDSCALLTLQGDELPLLCKRAHCLAEAVETASICGVVEAVPAFSSVAVHYDPAVLSYDHLKQSLVKLLTEGASLWSQPGRQFEVPACYGGQFGPDLEEVAVNLGLRPDEVTRRHASADYTVGLIGFTPGFPYLLGLDPGLATRRRDRPRTQVAQGSVGIGGRQTGIYSLKSPGGWNIIGRTPWRLFDPSVTPPSLLRAGDMVRFVPIDEIQFWKLRDEKREESFHAIERRP